MMPAAGSHPRCNTSISRSLDHERIDEFYDTMNLSALSSKRCTTRVEKRANTLSRASHTPNGMSDALVGRNLVSK